MYFGSAVSGDQWWWWLWWWWLWTLIIIVVDTFSGWCGDDDDDEGYLWNSCIHWFIVLSQAKIQNCGYYQKSKPTSAFIYRLWLHHENQSNVWQIDWLMNTAFIVKTWRRVFKAQRLILIYWSPLVIFFAFTASHKHSHRDHVQLVQGLAIHFKVPTDFFDVALWLCVTGSGQLWRRFIYPYSLPPLCLGKLCDSRVSNVEKQNLADWYVSLPDCCRSTSFCKPLLTLCTSASDLCPNGILHTTLDACFRTPATNIQCENNFARAQSAKQATRGRSDHSSQLCAKHILAEVKALHRKDFIHRRRAKHPPILRLKLQSMFNMTWTHPFNATKICWSCFCDILFWNRN